MWHTECPSVQGVWSPFTNMDPALNVTQFPNEELSKPVWEEKSATEELLEIINKQKVSNESDIDTHKIKAAQV